MDFNELREYLIADERTTQLVGEHIFLFERPEELECDDYIIYSPKEQRSPGGNARAYQIDINVVSRDKLKLLRIKDRLIELLDNHNCKTMISGIRNISLINGGGIVRADNGDYHAFLYFYAII